MPVYEFTAEEIIPLNTATFNDLGLHERRDLQRLLRDNISVIAPDTLVIAEEFGEWDESRRRIDLLGIDRDANLVVIELKRTEDGGHMDLQAIRYAAMVSTMTFDQAVDVFGRYLVQTGKEDIDARTGLLDFLGWDQPDDDAFAQDVRIVLASAEFSRELTTSILWLVERAIDIRCVRLRPYDLGGRILVDAQQIIPLPEAAEYQVQLREKARKEREARSGGAEHTRYDLMLGDRTFPGEPKRRVIYRTFRHLVESGIEPEKVVRHCGPAQNRWMRLQASSSSLFRRRVGNPEVRAQPERRAMHRGHAFGRQQLGHEVLVGSITLPDGAVLPISPARRIDVERAFRRRALDARRLVQHRHHQVAAALEDLVVGRDEILRAVQRLDRRPLR
jgi:hypothetical protein